MPKKTAPSTLKGHAKEIWESAYQSAWKQYDPEKHTGTQEEFAAKVAWGAVKRDYKKNKDGKWVAKSLPFASFRLRVTKSRFDEKKGLYKWHAQAANDEIDGVSEGLHPSLFDDFAYNFNLITGAYDNGKAPPDLGRGPANYPILDLAHYSCLIPPEQRDAARLGPIIRLYRDGRYLHADGYYDDTEIGQMVAESIQSDKDNKIRVSVGFFPDWGNIEIRDDVLIFKGGRDKAYLDHLAVTSCPKIPSTSIETEVTMSDENVMTMADDAQEILGEAGTEIIESLEALVSEGLELESQAGMVLRSDTEEEEGETEVVEETVSDEEIVEEISTEEVLPESQIVTESVTEGGEEDTEIVETEDVLPESLESEEPLPEVVMSDAVTMAGPYECECTKCSHTMTSDEHCRDVACPECGSEMRRADRPSKKSDVVTEAVYEDTVADVRKPLGGAISFEEALKLKEAEKESWRIADGWNVLRQVMENIMKDDEVEDKPAAMDKATAEFQAYLKSDERVYSDAAESDDVAEETIADEVVGDTPVEEVAVEQTEQVIPEPVEQVQPTIEAPLIPTAMRATSFGDALKMIGKARKEMAVQHAQQVLSEAGMEVTPAVTEQPIEGGVGISAETVYADDVEINQVVAQVMSAVRKELDQLKQELLAVKAETEDTPHRPQRKSKPGPPPPIDVPRVTEQAKTFSDVVNRLLDENPRGMNMVVGRKGQ